MKRINLFFIFVLVVGIACDASSINFQPTPAQVLVPTQISLPTAYAPATATFTNVPAVVLETVTPEIILTDTPAPTETAMATNTAGVVMVNTNAAAFNVRRGPGKEYNIIATLFSTDGNIRVAGRNGDGLWLKIPLAAKNAFDFGWVPSDSKFIVVSGDIGSLPFETFDAAVPAYVRNCTTHTLWIKSIDTLIPNVTTADEKYKVQVNPGVYTIYDNDVTGPPQVFSDEIEEGDTIDIKVDGLGNSNTCP